MQSAFVLGLKRFCYMRYTLCECPDICERCLGAGIGAACSIGDRARAREKRAREREREREKEGMVTACLKMILEYWRNRCEMQLFRIICATNEISIDRRILPYFNHSSLRI